MPVPQHAGGSAPGNIPNMSQYHASAYPAGAGGYGGGPGAGGSGYATGPGAGAGGYATGPGAGSAGYAAGPGSGAGGYGAGSAAGGSTSTPSHYSSTQPAQSYYGGPASTSDHGYPAEYAAYAAYANQYQHTSLSSQTSPTNASFATQQGQQQPLGIPGRDFRHPSPGPSLGQASYNGQGTPTDPSVSGSSSGPGGAGMIPSSKEREAMAARRVANPDGGPVMQHTDGGRLDATPEDEEPSEVPPRYDTIPHDR